MADDDRYSVRINRRDGIVEIAGPDKEWITDLVDRLAVVYEVPASQEDETPLDDTNVGNAGDESKSSSRTSRAAQTPAKPKRTRRSGTGFRGTVNPDLQQKMTADVQKKLVAYRDARSKSFKRAVDQVAIIATFLKDELNFEPIGPDDLYTVYSVMGWRAFNPRDALHNAKQRENYFGSKQGGSYPLAFTGEQFGRHDSLDT